MLENHITGFAEAKASVAFPSGFVFPLHVEANAAAIDIRFTEFLDVHRARNNVQGSLGSIGHWHKPQRRSYLSLNTESVLYRERWICIAAYPATRCRCESFVRFFDPQVWECRGRCQSQQRVDHHRIVLGVVGLLVRD